MQRWVTSKTEDYNDHSLCSSESITPATHSRSNGSVHSKRAHPPPPPRTPIPGICRAFYNFVLLCGNRLAWGWGIVKGNFIFSILKDVHASLLILNFLSAPNIKILHRVDKPCLRTGSPPSTPHGKFHLELEKGIVVLLLCSVPDRIDFAIVERLRKFSCSSPVTCRYFLIAFEQSDFSLLLKL